MINEPLTTGSVVKIWNENRGHDYVIIGISGSSPNKKIALVKNTCINNNGKFHASTTKIHSWIKIKKIEDFNTADRVVRVEGVRSINREHVADFVRDRCNNLTLRALKRVDDVYPSLSAVDARISTTYI